MAEVKKPPQSDPKPQAPRKARPRDDRPKTRPAKAKTRVTFTDFASI